jgi:Lipopolysaccharide-assembly
MTRFLVFLRVIETWWLVLLRRNNHEDAKTRINAPAPRLLRCVAALLLLVMPGCGYRVRSSVQNLPGGIESLGIPTFGNATHQYKVEQQITRAVLKEFSARTRIPINSSSLGVDAVLAGEIRSFSSSPVTFGLDTFGSAFLVTVHMAVKLTRVKDGAVLWENPNYVYSERYVLNAKIIDFFSEENPALERLARDFAASLASTLLSH